MSKWTDDMQALAASQRRRDMAAEHERKLRAQIRAEVLREAAKQVDLLAEYYEGEADIPTELNKNAVRVMRMVAQRIELMAAWPDMEAKP